MRRANLRREVETAVLSAAGVRLESASIKSVLTTVDDDTSPTTFTMALKRTAHMTPPHFTIKKRWFGLSPI